MTQEFSPTRAAGTMAVFATGRAAGGNGGASPLDMGVLFS